VVIIGAGVIGLAVGWRALDHGLSVVIVDRGAPGQETSRVAAGMIAPVSEASPSEPELLALGQASAALYPRFVDRLQYTAGFDVGYRAYGTLFVARDDDERGVLERELAFRRQLGLPVRRLLASEARAIEPALAPTLRLALSIEDDHAIDPRALTGALLAAFERAGGEVLTGAAAASVSIAGDRVAGVELAGGTALRTEQVVIAAGPWSGDGFGLPEEAQVPLRPVKGQILALRDPAGPGMLEHVLRMQPGYLVPRGDGRYVLGATLEERGFDQSATAGAVFELLRDATELVPGVSEWVIDELMVGTRPGTPDNLPILGPSPMLGGLHWATGHHRHGIMLTPLTADLIVAGLTNQALPELAAPVAPGRFNRETVSV
jgi:glycine oxidase